jgi:fatty-acyl-CoA synthase
LASATDGASQIVFPSERIAFSELHERADLFAGLLRRRGVRPGDKVGLFLDASTDLLVSLFGAMRFGCCVVPISDRFRSNELGYVIRHSELTALVTTMRGGRADLITEIESALLPDGAAVESTAGPAAQDVPAIFVWHAPENVQHLTLPLTPVELTDHFDDDDGGALAEIENSIDPASAAYLMYTSGTSAAPKGCVISHHAVLCQAESLAHARYLLTPDDAFWCPLPLFHNGGLATLSACLASGAKFVHTATFEPGQALRMLAEHRCSHAIPAFETIWLRVLDHPDFSGYDLSALRVVLNAGTIERLRQLQSRTPDVSQVANYGCTEATGHLSITLIDDPLEIRLTTGGHPLPGMQARIVDPQTGALLAAGEVGEICFRGPSRFTEYYKDPEATSAAIDADGWYHSGDRGRVDSDGRLTFLGRLKEMLKVGGENVSASEVEEYLLTHPAVNIAAVVGVRDAYYDEVPAAFVELVAGQDVSERELIDYCLGKIATYKVPRYVRYVTEWPMSGTKIQKFRLSAQLAAELDSRGIEAAPKISSGRAAASPSARQP